MLNEVLQTFIQVVRVSAYISKIISAAADEGPDDMMCFPTGIHYFFNFPNTNVQNIIEIDVSLCELFRERVCFVGAQKNRLNKTLDFFLHSNAYFCKIRTECKIRGQ